MAWLSWTQTSPGSITATGGRGGVMATGGSNATGGVVGPDAGPDVGPDVPVATGGTGTGGVSNTGGTMGAGGTGTGDAGREGNRRGTGNPAGHQGCCHARFEGAKEQRPNKRHVAFTESLPQKSDNA